MAADGLRFFVDENLIAVGKSLVAVRRDVAYPGHPRLPEVPTGTDDVEWLPTVGSLGLVAITRDKRIRSRPAERAAMLAAGARLVVLTGTSDLGKWLQLDLLVRSWPRLEEALDEPGPWVKGLTYGSLLDLPTELAGKPKRGQDG